MSKRSKYNRAFRNTVHSLERPYIFWNIARLEETWRNIVQRKTALDSNCFNFECPIIVSRFNFERKRSTIWMEDCRTLHIVQQQCLFESGGLTFWMEDCTHAERLYLFQMKKLYIPHEYFCKEILNILKGRLFWFKGLHIVPKIGVSKAAVHILKGLHWFKKLHLFINACCFLCMYIDVSKDLLDIWKEDCTGLKDCASY